MVLSNNWINLSYKNKRKNGWTYLNMTKVILRYWKKSSLIWNLGSSFESNFRIKHFNFTICNRTGREICCVIIVELPNLFEECPQRTGKHNREQRIQCGFWQYLYSLNLNHKFPLSHKRYWYFGTLLSNILGYWVWFCEDFAWYICLFLMTTTFIVWLTNQNDGCSPFPKDKLSCSVRFFFFFFQKHICLQGWLNKQPFHMWTYAKKFT